MKKGTRASRNENAPEKESELPETMNIRILTFTNGGKTRSKYQTIIMTVKPTTIVAEIKDFVLEKLPMIEHKRLEIGTGFVNYDDYDAYYEDHITMQEIYDDWPYFLKVKLLHMHISARNSTFKKMYNYFINRGIAERVAKHKTELIMKFFKYKGVTCDKAIAVKLKQIRNQHWILVRSNMEIPQELCEMYPLFD